MNKLQEIFQAWNIAFDPDNEQSDLAAKRIEICNGCDKKVTNLGINRCSVCGCALKGKVFSPVKGACPEGKWDLVDGALPEPAKPVELDKIKDKTIFVQIASYRDPELKPTLKDLLANADRPEDLTICIAWQHSPDDKWDNLDEYKNDSRFIIIDIPHHKAKGACWARNMIQGNYSNQAYTLQLDSHHRFIKGWDTELIEMHENLVQKGIKKPLLTAYLPSYDPKKDPKGRLDEVWKMTFNRFTPEGYIFTYPANIDNFKELKEPVRARFFSAHFTFTTGEFCVDVPHDPFMYFHGEEPSLASRAYTYGYDLFHPHKVIAWHFYTREGFVKHWDDDKKWSEKDKISHKRFRILHKMEQAYIDEAVDVSRFGFGTERTLEDYERYAGVRYRDRKVQQHTLDFRYPPNPAPQDPVEYEKTLLSKFKHCIDIHRSHFKLDDYEYWVVSFEMNDGTVVNRNDAGPEEIKGYLNKGKKTEWVKIWRDFLGQHPDKWVVWPYSKSKGFVERLEGSLNG